MIEQVRTGKTYQKIAEALGVRHGTVRVHMRLILLKLECKTRKDLARKLETWQRWK